MVAIANIYLQLVFLATIIKKEQNEMVLFTMQYSKETDNT
jgi:hypothetical protein